MKYKIKVSVYLVSSIMLFAHFLTVNARVLSFVGAHAYILVLISMLWRNTTNEGWAHPIMQGEMYHSLLSANKDSDEVSQAL